MKTISVPFAVIAPKIVVKAVIPAGLKPESSTFKKTLWIPAFSGMTMFSIETDCFINLLEELFSPFLIDKVSANILIYPMPILDWIGKRQVINHDKEVPFRLLKRVESLSVGERLFFM